MLIKVIRKWFTPKSSSGIISVDGVKCGFSLEDVARPHGVKIPNETAIPAGDYKVILDYSNRFKRVMPHILDVPGFEGVRIHGGNTAENTSGCILVGLEKGEDKIYNCQPTFDYIYHSIEQARNRGEEVTILIINEQIC